ncbi:two component transcriptional regulator, winged helix family [Denitrovibrio acetiphilus DSM 12809]|uniref:Two component transcriptional regulator, winged helix family n=1 Tax=Denitrovibrio acetiphilus (strain DSM 12809 / NBRC 114555 / N2460) TaxID=522772 RepID=D4H5D9_DENA2|nr:response regulator transcription factor [Denitrovibrio acetiphilus]ADD67559.1 two component transcriptional regulator, winged helix family [Denitrovibrio acetiphilus DSM 12809]
MNKNSKILVIDDDVELCELLSEYLEAEGFSIKAVHNGKEGASTVIDSDFDLIILDVMLPGMGGFDVLKTIRSVKMTPILMLTAKGDDIDKILGLEIGADDYLPKPYNPRELLARIKAILRRYTSPHYSEKAQELTGGNFVLDTGKLTASYRGFPLGLTVVEFNILEMLLINIGRVVTREEIALKVLGRELSSFDRSIDVHISNIRKKASDTDIIKSIRGAGYQLIPEND